MKLKETLFLLSCVVFVLFCIWYAISEFGKSLDGWKPVQVEEIEVNKRDGKGKIYTVRELSQKQQGHWKTNVLELERGE